MIDLHVKVGGWSVGEVTHGVDCQLERYPVIVYPQILVKKEVIPERFIPLYKVDKTGVKEGSMTLVINTIPMDDLEVEGNLSLLYKNYVEPLTHEPYIEVDFKEESGILYICEVESLTVENIGETSHTYRYTLALKITEIKTREV